MTKGTTSQGPRHTKVHTTCRRCGRKTWHIQNKRCGACGYPGKRMRHYDGWACKVRGRKGQGTGRMKHLRKVPQKAKNGFRCENNYVKASTAKKATGKKDNKLNKAKIPRRRLL